MAFMTKHMYHPLLVFDGLTGFPMACVLHAGNTHVSHGSVAVLRPIIKRLKRAYPKAYIVFRADAAFCRGICTG